MKQNLILQGISSEENDFMIAYFESMLGGAAPAFFKATKIKTNSPKTFKDWVEKIKLKFPEGRDQDIHQMFLFDRKQKLAESVFEFGEELRKLAKLAYPDLDSRAHDKRDAIKFREYDSLADAIKSSTFIESQLFREDLAINNNTINTSGNLKGSMMSTYNHQYPTRRGRQCYNCDSFAHLRNQCPELPDRFHAQWTRPTRMSLGMSNAPNWERPTTKPWQRSNVAPWRRVNMEPWRRPAVTRHQKYTRPWPHPNSPPRQGDNVGWQRPARESWRRPVPSNPVRQRPATPHPRERQSIAWPDGIMADSLMWPMEKSNNRQLNEHSTNLKYKKVGKNKPRVNLLMSNDQNFSRNVNTDDEYLVASVLDSNTVTTYMNGIGRNPIPSLIAYQQSTSILVGNSDGINNIDLADM